MNMIFETIYFFKDGFTVVSFGFIMKHSMNIRSMIDYVLLQYANCEFLKGTHITHILDFSSFSNFQAFLQFVNLELYFAKILKWIYMFYGTNKKSQT